MLQAEAEVMLTPDEDLIRQARSGDVAAREELFRRHFNMAYRVAFRQLGQEQDAQDAVQDAFVKALRHLDDFDGRSGFKTWLMRIVTNAAFDLGRRRKRRPTQRIEDAENGEGGLDVATHDDPAVGLYQADLRKTLYAALDRLSPTLRQTFVLFAEAEMSYKEIAETLEIPPGTVMSRLHQARQKLIGFLGEVDGIE